MRSHFYTINLKPIIDSQDKFKIIQYLQLKGILKQNQICFICGTEMLLKKYSRNKDEFAFRCIQNTCKNYKKYFSVRKGSIFEGYGFTLNIGLLLIYKWVTEIPQSIICKEVDIDRKVLMEFFNDLKKCCENYFLENPVKLGGDGVICQIDESLFRHKPKYHRGRATNYEIWVFGIVDTSYTPAKAYLQIVNDRSSNTLLPIIKKVCRENSIINSDQWKAYNRIRDMGFNHDSVNHSLHFVDPNTGVHTQTVESYWAKVKRRIKIHKGIIGEKIAAYLSEWMWKDNVYNDEFQNVVDLIKLYF